MSTENMDRHKPAALSLLSAERPRNVGWKQAAGLLFGDWGTSRLYVLGLAFFYAGSSSIYLIAAMSLLILLVGWAYTQICRIYPDGGGVYSAARQKNRMLAVVGALLLFADYVVTASLSSLDGFHYFGLNATGSILQLGSPGLWAMVAIVVIGVLNLTGPKHTGSFAIAAAAGMVGITLLLAIGALPQIDWSHLPSKIGPPAGGFQANWFHFVAIVLALSGVEAIGNLTGVMNRPVAKTSSKAIWVVAAEVALFNIALGLCMVAKLSDAERADHKEDMLAFLGHAFIGPWAEFGVRAIGGLLLLSAVNTVITDMISVQYLLSRDGELPQFFQKLNRFGVPWVAAVLATIVPCVVLFLNHDLEHLAALYAIGVVGAVAINITLVSTHPRLRGMRRKIPALAIGLLLMAIWVTLAVTKLHALIFVCAVLAIGLTARAATKLYHRTRGEQPSLLRLAVLEQLPPQTMGKRRILLGTYGSDRLAVAALEEAQREEAVLVVCFIREVSLSYKYDGEQKFTIDTDTAALKTFAKFLDIAHGMGVPVLPVYDTGAEASELMAEQAALHGCSRILIGSSRQGALYHLIKGRFQRRLEAILPPDITVRVIHGPDSVDASGSNLETAY